MNRSNDSSIQKKVMDELSWDTRVCETDIGVEVHEGIVTLNGTVDSWAGRTAADQAAHRVAGVLDVANEIKVKLPGADLRDDTDIAKAVRHTLDWDVLIPADRIRSSVTRGVVTLEGTVDHWNEFDDAAKAVRNLKGVQEVHNLIVVAPPKVSTHVVRAAIDQALARHAAHAARHVTIAIEDDQVTLRGEVPSWAEHEAIEGAVRGTRGVRKVDNRLLIHA